MALEPGSNLGSYRIVEQAGAGGMATVYKAYQPALTRFVAIKVLPPYFAQDSEFAQRFQREAINVARLRHPNILTIFDYGEENGLTYIVTEFVDGGTLADQLSHALPVDYAVRILRPVAAALDYAHSLGMIHRDIKPSNILLWHDGTPTLSDFGLAKMMDQPGITSTAVNMGTPEYMAPEQGAGEAAGPSSDLYALGIIAYQIVTGRVPFRAETPLAVLLAHLNSPLPMPRQVNSSLSDDVEAVLLKALAKTPTDRYRTATEFIAALEAACVSDGTQHSDTHPHTPSPEPRATMRSAYTLGARARTEVVTPEDPTEPDTVVMSRTGRSQPMYPQYDIPAHVEHAVQAHNSASALNYYTDVLRKYTQFSGRATRSEYWIFGLFQVVIIVTLAIVDGVLKTNGILFGLYVVATMLPWLAVSVRRLLTQIEVVGGI